MLRFVKAILLILIVLQLSVVSAWAEEANKQPLTLNDSIAMALKNNESVKKASKELDKAEALRKHSAEQFDATPVGLPGGSIAVDVAWTNLLTADLSWRMTEKNFDVQEDALVLDTCKKYWDVQTANISVETAKLSQAQAEADLRKTLAIHRVGMVSNEALMGAETKLLGAKANLRKAENTQATAYISFNQLIGMSPDDRPLLIEDINYSPQADNDVNYLVARVMSKSPSVWLAEESVNMQKHMQNLLFATGQFRPYEARKADVEQAQLDAISARKATELITRNLFYSVKSLEENYPAVEQAVKLAGEALKNTKLRYDLGMVTKAEVIEAEVSLMQARQNMLEIKKNHAYYKLALEKPWAYLKSPANQKL